MLVFLGTFISIVVAWKRPMQSKSNGISSFQKNGWRGEVMGSNLARCMGNSPIERDEPHAGARGVGGGEGEQLEMNLIL